MIERLYNICMIYIYIYIYTYNKNIPQLIILMKCMELMQMKLCKTAGE